MMVSMGVQWLTGKLVLLSDELIAGVRASMNDVLKNSKDELKLQEVQTTRWIFLFMSPKTNDYRILRNIVREMGSEVDV